MRVSIQMKKTCHHKQAGLSLLELLIAMFIGLFLLVGISSSYLSSKKNSIIRNQFSILEDNGRLALEVMTRTLEHTGYTSAAGVPLSAKFIQAADLPITSSGCEGGDQSVKNPAIITSSTADNSNGDSIGVIYLGDSNISTDCSGGPLPENCQLDPDKGSSINPSKIYSSFFLDAATNELKCAGSRVDSVETIAEGVENIQILYGVDVDVEGDRIVDRYVNADNVGPYWNSIINIQIAILVRSPREVKDKSEAITYTLLDTPVATNDRYQRAVFSTTISLRNTL